MLKRIITFKTNKWRLWLKGDTIENLRCILYVIKNNEEIKFNSI